MRKFRVTRRDVVLAAVAAVVMLTAGARWSLNRTGYTGLVIFPDLTVVRVLADAPSPNSGIRPGDRLLAFDGRRLGSLAEYLKALKEPALAGRQVTVEVQRGKEPLTFPLNVGSYPLLDSSPSVLGPAFGIGLLAFGIYVFLRRPADPVAGLYLGLTTCLFVLLALRCHPGYLALHSP